MKKRYPYKKNVYAVEVHPFETFIPDGAKYLIIGTFPTFKANYKYNFFYSSERNHFWQVMSRVFDMEFRFQEGEVAVSERKELLRRNSIAITDMHVTCYRRNKSSSDENLYPIILKDIFSLLRENPSIDTLIFTSRTEIVGAWGLFRTYCLQKGVNVPELKSNSDKILKGSLTLDGSVYKILIPYSTSPKVMGDGKVTLDTLLSMYKSCFLTP